MVHKLPTTGRFIIRREEFEGNYQLLSGQPLSKCNDLLIFIFVFFQEKKKFGSFHLGQDKGREDEASERLYIKKLARVIITISRTNV